MDFGGGEDGRSQEASAVVCERTEQGRQGFDPTH
jgi:hypothetical protein